MMMNKIRVIFTIFVFTGVLTSCAIDGKKPQTFEIIGPAEGITPEEELVIKSKSTFIPVGAVSTLAEAKPAIVNVYPVFTIHKKESLYSAISRLYKISGYTRLIYDLSFGAPSPDQIDSRKKYTTKKEQEILPQIEYIYKESYPQIRVFEAGDVGGLALVVTDKPYPSWHALRIYDVPKGTLRDAVHDLAQTIGWSIEAERGYTARNYPIDNTFPIVIAPSDPKTTFTSLLSSFPAKARLHPNTRTATIVERVLPKQN
jgi:hypothetical protein